MVWSYKGVGRLEPILFFYKEDKMKIKMYTVYYNGEKDMHFLRKKQAIKYVEYLKYYKINEEDNIYYRKEYIYV